MKRIFSGLLYALIVTTAWGQSEPITTLQGDQGTKFGSPKLVTPNLQATKTAKGGRIETGNSNLLSNPSFEHTTVNTGWTCSLGTVSTATGTDGTQGLGIVSAGAGVRCYQLSTINAANLKGLLGQARAKVKTTDTIMKVCGLVDGNGAANERNCVDVAPTTTDNVFFPAQTQPFQMGGTSNGIVIYTTTTTTQPTVIDVAHVGVLEGSLASFSNNTGFANAGAMTIGAVTTPPTTGTVVLNEYWWKRDTTNIKTNWKFRQSTAGTAGSGDYLFPLPVVNGVQLSFNTNVVKPYSGSMFASNGPITAAFVGTGSESIGGTTNAFCRAVAYDSTRFRMICYGASSNAGTVSGVAIGSGAHDLTQAAASYNANIDAPIAGWEANTNAAIAGCVDAKSCTEEYTIVVSSVGAISQPNVTGWISGNCTVSATAQYDCPIATGLVSSKMNCTPVVDYNIFSNRSASYDNANSTNTNIRVRTFDGSSGAALATGFTLRCSKQSPDFKPKTVVVSPLQGYVKVAQGDNLNVEVFRYSYGNTISTTCTTATCAYLDQISNISPLPVVSVTRSGAGAYLSTYSRTYSKLKCIYSVGNGANGGVTMYNTGASCSNCNTLQFSTGGSPGVLDTYGTVDCMGTY